MLEELSGAGALSLVPPSCEVEWVELEKYLKNMTSGDLRTDPFQKDQRKAYRPEDLSYNFPPSMQGTDYEVPDDTPLSEVISMHTVRESLDRPRKVKSLKRGRSSHQYSHLAGPFPNKPSATQSAESSEESGEHLIRKRTKPSPGLTSSPHTVPGTLQDASQSSPPVATNPMMTPTTTQIDIQATHVSYFAPIHATPHQQKSQVASEVIATHTEDTASAPESGPTPASGSAGVSADGGGFDLILSKMVETADSSMVPKDFVSALEASYRDTSVMKFCGMAILSLSKKFEQHESELAKLRVESARANELRLAA